MQRLILGAVLLSSTLALLLLVASANTCRFVFVAAISGDFVEVIDTSATGGDELTRTFFDAFCDGHLVNLGGDTIWLFCKIFHVCAIALAASAAFLGVMVNVVAPRIRPLCWQILSVCSALCSLISVPVFLLFESEPCKDFPRQQSCSFALASYIHVAAIVFAIISTICTQCFDPPTTDDRYSPADKKKPDSRRYWFPLQSEHEDVDQEENRFHDSLLEKGAVATKTTEEFDEEEDRAQSDAGVIGVSESHEELARSLLPLDLSYENQTAVATHAQTSCATSDITLPENEAAGVDLCGPTVVYEALEREGPPLLHQSERLIPNTLDVSTPVVLEPRKIDLAKLPSLIDKAEVDEDSEEPVEDLGSLEPTVITINGAESVLDQADSSERKPDELSKDTPTTTTQDEISGETKMEIPKRKTIQLDISRLIAPRRRKGYRLMDDTDLDSSLPMSPPLEIVTMNMINTSLEYDDFEDLYENGKKGLDAQLHQPGRHQPIRIEMPQDDDEMDPELLWNDDDDFVGIVSSLSNRSYEVCDVDHPEQLVSPLAARPSCSFKRRRNRRWNGCLSLASANSLLSYTIAEETDSDLIDTDEEDDTQKAFDPYGTPNLDPIPLTKSRSAPNLARFDRPIKNEGWVVEDLQLTGVHTYKKKAQIFSTAESSSVVSARRSTGGMKDKEASKAKTSIRPSSASSLPGVHRSGGKRLSTFREEKVFREGIHATSSHISDMSNVYEGLKSLPLQNTINAQDARDARIRRLQNSASPIRQRPEQQDKPTIATTLPLKSSRPPRPPPAPAVVSPYSSPISMTSPQQVIISPDSLKQSSGEDSYDTSFDSSFTLNMLDATLTALTSDFDPDERSV